MDRRNMRKQAVSTRLSALPAGWAQRNADIAVNADEALEVLRVNKIV